MDLFRTVVNDGLRMLFAAGIITALVLVALTVERATGGLDRDLAQQLTIHHFERSSWFALNAGKYERIDRELTSQFRESALWHARRAREFQRMTPDEVVTEADRDYEQERREGRLMERALRTNATLDTRVSAAVDPDTVEKYAWPSSF